MEVKQMFAKGYTSARIIRELQLERHKVYKWKNLDVVPVEKKGP